MSHAPFTCLKEALAVHNLKATCRKTSYHRTWYNLMNYVLTDISNIREPHKELADLATICFAEYQGTIQLTPDFMRWYLARPGMTAKSCFATLYNDAIVSSLLVTRLKVKLGGQWLHTGVVDTVMTHPAHRRRGLATTIINHAVDYMKTEGLDVALLYTDPRGPAFRLYTRVGFRVIACASFYIQTIPAAQGIRQTTTNPQIQVRTASQGDTSSIRSIINKHYAEYDGYADLDEELWRWRKLSRPQGWPATVLVAETEGRLAGTATISPAVVRAGGKLHQWSIVTDLVVPQEESGAMVVHAMLEYLPKPSTCVVLLGDGATVEEQACSTAGFQASFGDVAMVRALSPKGYKAIASRSSKWYVLVESLIGLA